MSNKTPLDKITNRDQMELELMRAQARELHARAERVELENERARRKLVLDSGAAWPGQPSPYSDWGYPGSDWGYKGAQMFPSPVDAAPDPDNRLGLTDAELELINSEETD